MRDNRRMLVGLMAVLAMLAAACGDDAAEPTATGTDTVSGATEAQAEAEATDPVAAEGEVQTESGEGGEALSGEIQIDGSSTVEPLTAAIAEVYAEDQPDVNAVIGVSGTGGGFERFCAGDTDISNASRPISEEEVALCEENGIAYTEVRVGTDALTMVTNPATEFVDCLTTDEVIAIWGPDGASTWSEVNPEFPDEQLAVFAPGADSGTYDFFNETILEPEGIEEPRQDFNASEDDNIIAQGVQGTPGSWGYFGFAYFVNSAEQLNAIAYDAGDGCVEPSVETAQDDSYGLTRPLFIYVKNESLAEPHVADFVNFYLDNVNELITDVGYIPAPEDVITEAQSNLEAAVQAAG